MIYELIQSLIRVSCDVISVQQSRPDFKGLLSYSFYMSYFAIRQSALILVAVQWNLILITDSLLSGSVVVAHSCICPNLQTSVPHAFVCEALENSGVPANGGNAKFVFVVVFWILCNMWRVNELMWATGTLVSRGCILRLRAVMCIIYCKFQDKVFVGN